MMSDFKLNNQFQLVRCYIKNSVLRRLLSVCISCLHQKFVCVWNGTAIHCLLEDCHRMMTLMATSCRNVTVPNTFRHTCQWQTTRRVWKFQWKKLA